jgi:demethylmenaquinone methyltransferase/2-methoxy-6-polyprenyl-1,4-benzoquinol methylase
VTPPRTPVDPSYLRDLFSRNARTYDAVNTLISFHQVERWRRELVSLAGVHPGDAVLDAFAGPGSLARHAAARLAPQGRLVLADLSPVMLAVARRRLEHVHGPRPVFVTTDVLALDTELGCFDVVLVGFGLRYVPDVHRTLERLALYLRPGGRLAVLEFTRPARATFALPAQWYFSRVLPRVAAFLAGDAEIYEYLSASSRAFLTGERLVAAFGAAGLEPTATRGYLGGLVTSVVGTGAGVTGS